MALKVETTDVSFPFLGSSRKSHKYQLGLIVLPPRCITESKLELQILQDFV